MKTLSRVQWENVYHLSLFIGTVLSVKYTVEFKKQFPDWNPDRLDFVIFYASSMALWTGISLIGISTLWVAILKLDDWYQAKMKKDGEKPKKPSNKK